MSDYRIKVTIRNAKILRALEDAGFTSQAEFSRFSGTHLQDLNALIGMRRSPMTRGGTFTESAKALMAGLCCSPEELWTEDQLFLTLEKNTVETDVCTEIAKQLMSPIVENNPLLINIEKDVSAALEVLTTRERKIIKMRYYNSMTLDEIGEREGVTRSRISEIERRALRKLRHPTNNEQLKSLFSEL